MSRNQPTYTRTLAPTNRRIGDKSYKLGTDNTRKNKFCSNKTSTYPARNGSVRWVRRENILQNVLRGMAAG